MPTIAGRPMKYKTKEELQEKIDAYFKECKDKGKPLTVTGLAIACDLDRHQLLSYGENDEFYHTIKKAKEKVHLYAEENLFRTNGNVTGVIFNLKNNWGWVDRYENDANVSQEVNIKVNVNDNL